MRGSRVYRGVEQLAQSHRPLSGAERVGGMPRQRIEDLYDAWHPRAYRLALRMTLDEEEAWDVVQEAFLRPAAVAAASLVLVAAVAAMWLWSIERTQRQLPDTTRESGEVAALGPPPAPRDEQGPSAPADAEGEIAAGRPREAHAPAIAEQAEPQLAPPESHRAADTPSFRELHFTLPSGTRVVWTFPKNERSGDG